MLATLLNGPSVADLLLSYDAAVGQLNSIEAAITLRDQRITATEAELRDLCNSGREWAGRNAEWQTRLAELRHQLATIHGEGHQLGCDRLQAQRAVADASEQLARALQARDVLFAATGDGRLLRVEIVPVPQPPRLPVWDRDSKTGGFYKVPPPPLPPPLLKLHVHDLPIVDSLS